MFKIRIRPDISMPPGSFLSRWAALQQYAYEMGLGTIVVPTFLMKCPACGKRFDVVRKSESVEKKIGTATTQESSFSSPMAEGVVDGGVYPVSEAEKISNSPTVDVKVPIEEDIYTETYTCKHCGHIWTETHEKDKVIGRDPGKTVDTVKSSDE
jgi:rubredoxin